MAITLGAFTTQKDGSFTGVLKTLNAMPSLNRHRPLRLTAQSAAISCIGAPRTPDGSAPGMPRHAGVRQTFTKAAINGLSDYGEIVAQCYREAPSASTARSR